MNLSLGQARGLDDSDPLRRFRGCFALPVDAHGEPLTYLCGHSLGLAPLAARALLTEVVDDWSRLGVLGHEQARHPWVGYAEQLNDDLALLVGAAADEVVAMNSLTVNLHLLLASFYRPTPHRHRILIEAGAFPSDRYALRSQLGWHGHAAAQSLIEVAPREGEDCLRAADVEAAIARAGDSLALVLWPGVQYLSGQRFDLAAIARAAHAVGAVIGFDLAHAIGNVPLSLHDDGADFAAWCSYKYLNAGPGAIGGAFVHHRHGDPTRARLTGWWGHDPATRFGMPEEFAAAGGAASWAQSNPPIFSAAPLLASLPLFREAGMTALRAKSVALTDYLAIQLAARCGGDIHIVTPDTAADRGAQLTLRIAGGRQRARGVFDAITSMGVVADWREPGLIRAAPVPLYNRYEDVWRFVEALAEALRAHGS